MRRRRSAVRLGLRAARGGELQGKWAKRVEEDAL